VRQSRQEYNDNGRTIIQEPGRTIVRENDGYFIRHDENERFRDLGYAVRSERRGDDFVSSYFRPDGEEIITFTDGDGRLLRRIRRLRDGREIVIIDNTLGGPPRSFAQDVVILPPPPLLIPEDRYIVDADAADESLIYETLMAPPVAELRQRYTLDQVRYSYDLRAHMRSVNLDTITFDTAAWDVTPDQFGRLAAIGKAVGQAIQRNPNEVFLVEGYTDAVGSDVDNLSLSDRRAQSIAAILTKSFGVPPENLTTQGYGKQYPRVRTLEASRENRRVTVQRITPLLDGNTPRQ